MNIQRFLLTLILSSLFSTSTYAEVQREKKLNFTVKGESLGRDDVVYSFAQGSPQDLEKNYPELAKLDSIGFLQEKSSSVIVSKVAYVVAKPIGFFDHENLVEEKFVKDVMGQQKVRKIGQDAFVVAVPGKEKMTYRLKIYVDSDDVSTLPHSRVTEAITAFRKLDILSQSASSISFREMSDFTHQSHGAIVVSSFVPLKEEKTLVISYYLTSLRSKGDVKKNEKNLVEEFSATKFVIERFK